MNVIIGLGETGMSCVRYCLRRGLPFAVTDSRENPPGLEELNQIAPSAIKALGGISRELIQEASRLIVSPGISLLYTPIAEASQRGIPVIGDIELFLQEVKAPVVGITGSNAKSTVTTLVGEMASKTGKKVVVAGNIGIPVLDVLDTPEAELFVLELSSFQLERTLSLKLKVAVLLNICEDHMDRHLNMEEYLTIKKRIYQQCEIAVINREDNTLWPDEKISTVIGFGLTPPNRDEFGLLQTPEGDYLALGVERWLSVNEIRISGRHNHSNALAALAIGHALQFPKESMLAVLREFPGLPHRAEFVREYAGVRWYNDSKGTNVGATLAALRGLGEICSGKIILLAGGIGKGADFSPLKPLLKKYVRKAILFGEAAKQMSIVFEGMTEIELISTFDKAVLAADLAAVRGDIVLLSPACASFDMFHNYEHRGEVFCELVREL